MNLLSNENSYKNKKLEFTVPDVVTQTKLPELRAYDNIDD
jgi:hypothetical protein